MCRAFGVRERRSRLDLAQQRDCTPCSPSNYSRSTALKHEHGVHWCTPFNPLSVEEWRKSGAARRSSLFESRNEHNWRCTACTTAHRSPAFGARNRLLWKVHGVHTCTACTLPDPAATIKREGGGKRKGLFPARFSPISPEFSLQKPAPNLI